MKIEPYQSVDSVSFQTSKEDLVATIGDPQNNRTNRLELEEFDYGSKIYRFTKYGILQEVTIDSESIVLEEKEHSFNGLEQYLKNKDDEVFDCHGFWVSPKFGLAFDPHYPSWITCFTEDGFKEWTKI